MLYWPHVEVARRAFIPFVILTGVPVAPLRLLVAVNIRVLPVELLAV